MKQDEIIEMAKQAGASADGRLWLMYSEDLVAFAKLVEERTAAKERADEREACALVCEAGINNATDWDSSAWDQACENRSYAIRARGQT